jgi:hypothetical protein
VVGPNSCRCSKFQAAFISPSIAQLLQIDSTIDDAGVEAELVLQQWTLLIGDLLRRESFSIEEFEFQSRS